VSARDNARLYRKYARANLIVRVFPYVVVSVLIAAALFVPRDKGWLAVLLIAAGPAPMAAYLASIKCYNCGFPVLRQFQGANADSLTSPVLRRVPDRCTKCGAPFGEQINA
jgi:hypothetical protein